VRFGGYVLVIPDRNSVLATEHIRSKNRKETVKQETFMPPISSFDGKEKEPIQLS